jgi:large subunit ribosomal protein L25
MSTELILQAKSRETTGTASARKLRHAGLVPATVYGSGKSLQTLEMQHNDLLVAMSKPGFFSEVLLLSINDKAPIKVTLKAHQMHCVNRQVLHVEFQHV